MLKIPGSVEPLQHLVPTAQPPQATEAVYAPAEQPMAMAQFVILNQIGSGGMGTVYAAYDRKLERKVALKVLHSSHRTSQARQTRHTHQAQRQSTLREAKALARVAHPRVVSVYEVAEVDDTVYLAMEFVDGITLRVWQSESRRGWREILDMYLQVGEGLSAVHGAGVVHRDFKPDNVLIGRDGMPRVADFGVASLHPAQPLEQEDDSESAISSEQDASPFTFQGHWFGTPGYMSPEQLEGANIDATSDQWSFCVALYEALYGRLPFSGGTVAEQSLSTRGPISRAPAASAVPEEIHHILLRGLSVEPSARFPSMDAVLSALTLELRHTAAGAGWSRRRMGLILAAVFAAGWIFIYHASSRYFRINGPALGISCVMIGTLLAAGYWHRRALAANAFHRRMWLLLVVTVTQNLLARVASCVKQIAPFFVYFTSEMIILFGLTLHVATIPVRPLRWLPLLPLTAGILAMSQDRIPRSAMLLVYPVTFLAVLWGWHRVALKDS